MGQDIDKHAVHPGALNAVAIAAIGIFLFGFALGPYAIWRARETSKLLDASPWLRGRWHLRVAYALGTLALIQGVVNLASKYIINPGGM